MALEFPYDPTVVADNVDFYLATHHNRQGAQISELTNRVNRFWANDAARPTPTVDPDFSDIYPFGFNVARATYEFWNGSAWIQIPLAIALTFLQLTDAPSDYSGQAGKAVLVKGTEDGLEFGAVVAGGDLIKLQEEILVGPVGIITFSSIPAIYSKLILDGVVRSTAGGKESNISLRMQNDAAGNYNYVRWNMTGVNTHSALEGRGSTSIVFGLVNSSGATANRFSPLKVEIFQYANADFSTGLLAHSGRSRTIAAGDVNHTVAFGEYYPTSAVNRIDLISSFDTNSRVTLYGVV